jgi:small multidrug resistance pump
MNKSQDASANPAPLWMARCLVAAGIYNLLWGGLTVLAPNWLFNLTGMDRPNYPFIWQCVGMIVGVYGIGYIAAASDPIRHWPIVLVGFLGKIFGPLGYAMGVIKGEVPPAFGVTLPTNDLIWWVPFALILAHAWRAHRETHGAAVPIGTSMPRRAAG